VGQVTSVAKQLDLPLNPEVLKTLIEKCSTLPTKWGCSPSVYSHTFLLMWKGHVTTLAAYLPQNGGSSRMSRHKMLTENGTESLFPWMRDDYRVTRRVNSVHWLFCLCWMYFRRWIHFWFGTACVPSSSGKTLHVQCTRLCSLDIAREKGVETEVVKCSPRLNPASTNSIG
jgi:hypothetical protein